MNINVEIFKRYSPKKKIEIINKLTPAELSMVEYATLDVYFQYENTDTTVCVIAQEFFSRGEYKGRVKRLNHHCDEQTYYFNYSEEEKREVMRSILLEYVYKKYKDKLSEGEE